MKNAIAVCFVVAVLAVASTASATTFGSSGSLVVTGTIESSISLTVETAPSTTGGTGTASAISALGNVSKFGSAPSGFQLTPGTSNWTLSATVGVKVVLANLTSDDYTLSAQLDAPPANGTVWKMNGFTLNESTATPVLLTGGYGSTEDISWDIVVADSATAGSIGNTINFTAASN